MATGQSVLDRMEILHPELQLQSGEDGVTKGLIAANMAQDYFESLLALHPHVFGDTSGTVTTTANTETTTHPAGVIRLDALWRLDANSRQIYKLSPIFMPGDHAPSETWPQSIADTSTGETTGYFSNGRLLYWSPMPDATYTIRWYGLQQQTDITASGSFLWPDICLTPFATFAVKAIRIGLDDSAEQLTALAGEVFEPVIRTLTNFRREGAEALPYAFMHTT